MKGRLYEQAMDELKATQEMEKTGARGGTEGSLRAPGEESCATVGSVMRDAPRRLQQSMNAPTNPSGGRGSSTTRSSFYPSASGDATNEAPTNDQKAVKKVLGKRKGPAEGMFGARSMLAKVLRLKCHATACKDRTPMFSCSFGFDDNKLEGQRRLCSPPPPPKSSAVPRYNCARGPASPAGEGCARN
jgi:hypothetical protein